MTEQRLAEAEVMLDALDVAEAAREAWLSRKRALEDDGSAPARALDEAQREYDKALWAASNAEHAVAEWAEDGVNGVRFGNLRDALATLRRVRKLADNPVHIVDASIRYDDGQHDRFGDGDVVTVEMLRSALDGTAP